MQALVDRSLLKADGARYWMLQTLREYALCKLDHGRELNELRGLHCRWFVDMVDSETLDLFAHPPDPAVLVPERENFRSAVEWAAESGDYEAVARLAAPLAWSLWVREGKLNEVERWLRIASERLDRYPLYVQAHVLSAARVLARRRGEYERGEALCEKAVAIYRQLGDSDGICWELVNRAVLAVERGQLTAGRAAFEEAILFARERNLTAFLASGLSNLADLAIAEGKLNEARTLCEEALTLPDRSQHDTGVALVNLAHVASLRGQYSDAANFSRAALTVALDHEDRHMGASATMELAWSLAEQGDPERAARLLGAAIDFFEDTGVTRQRTDEECEHATLQAMRDRLGEQRIQNLIREGRTMSLDAVARVQLEAG